MANTDEPPAKAGDAFGRHAHVLQASARDIDRWVKSLTLKRQIVQQQSAATAPHRMDPIRLV
jgi:hypothetical protein